MLSKQDKLKYGEELRRQMKQKQEKKKQDDLQKRGFKKSPTDPRLPIDPQPYLDNKQALQNRLEVQNNDYFSRPGGGAPNRQNADQNFGGNQLQYNNYEQNQYGRMKTSQEYQPYQNQQQFNQNFNYPQQQVQSPPLQQQKIGSQFENYPRSNLDNPYGGKGNPQNYQQYDQSLNYIQQQHQAYNYNNSGPYAPASFANPNIPQNQLNNIQQYNPRVPTDRSFVEQYQQYQSKQQYPSGYGNYPQQRLPPPQYIPTPVQKDIYQQPIQEINQKHDAFRQKTLENQELMQIHKKGGRNLLQLENMTIDQQQVKQKQKEEIRKHLEIQMRQAEEKKRLEKERIIRQEQQQQRKNIQYLQKKKRQLEEQQRKKNEKLRDLQQQNARNLDRRRLQEEAKQKALKQKMKQSNVPPPVAVTNPNSPKIKAKEVFSRQAQFQADETTSEVSSSTVMDKAFNTGVSKQFFENQRKKDQQRYNREKNLQAVTEEIKRLKEHIDKQNQFFKKQIQKVKLQSEMAESEKKKAEQQIQNLKLQLKKKMEDDNQRLFMALQRQQRLEVEDQTMRAQQRNDRRPPQRFQNENVQVLKPSQNQKYVKKQYQVPQQEYKKPSYNSNLEESNISDDGMLVSLHGDSKKIPINLPDDKLSMSQLSDFARETKFFKNQGKSPYLGSNNKKYSMQAQESIAQQDEQRAQSRAAARKQPQKSRNEKDQLDKFVQKRQKSRNGNQGHNNWGELSSVNSDITKQIQQLLKKKDNPYRPPSSTKYDNQYNLYPQYNSTNPNNDRPSSHLSNAGKRALSRNGLEYEGASLGTLNSNVGGNGTLGTVDIDRIQNRNDKRLKELRNLGVQTINTNGDQQFSKLDMILDKYKQSRVM